jgi:hypothetical protein
MRGTSVMLKALVVAFLRDSIMESVQAKVLRVSEFQPA